MRLQNAAVVFLTWGVEKILLSKVGKTCLLKELGSRRYADTACFNFDEDVKIRNASKRRKKYGASCRVYPLSLKLKVDIGLR